MQSSQASARMIGRDPDLRSLEESYDLASHNKPQAVVVAGEAGLGKTRLVGEFLQRLPEGARILSGQCVDLGPLATPYAPVTTALRTLASEVGLEALLELAGPGRDALALLLPEVPGPDRDDHSGNMVLEAVSTVLEKVSMSRPTVVVIEDLHWADDSTLAVLRFILRAFNGGQFLLVMTYRIDDVHRGHPLRAFLAEAERGRYATTIRLERLGKDEVRKQVEAITGTEADYELVEDVFGRSDGIPFFVEELVAVGQCANSPELPTTLRDLLLARYDRMEEPVQYFLRVLAAGGVCVRHSLAEQAYDRAEREFEEAARAAQQAYLIGIDGDSYTFRHALLREAIHEDLLPGERTRFHTRYAQALEAAASMHSYSAEIAHHWDAANVPEKTFLASVAAMGEAWGSFAYSTSARMGELALELWDRLPEPEAAAGMPRFRLMERTAAAHDFAGDGDRSLAVIRLAAADPGAQGTDLARLLSMQARYLGYNAKPGSRELLRRALDLVPPGTDEDLRSVLLNTLAGRYMLDGELDDAIATATEALSLARATGNPRERSIAANLRGVSRIHAGDVAGGRKDMEASAVMAEGNAQALFRFRINYSDALTLLGLYDESIQVAEAGIDRARELGVERTTGAMLSANAVEPLFDRGDWGRAVALMERGLQLSPPTSFRTYLLRSKIWSTLWGGDVAGAESLFKRWQPLIRQLSAVEMQSSLHLGTLAAELAWAGGRLDAAWQEVRFLFSPAFRPLPGYDLPFVAVAARILASRRQSGEVMDAGDEARLRELLQRDSFWPTHKAWLALVDAELSGPDGTGSSPDAWHRAGELVGALPAYLRHYVALRAGQAECAAGNRAEALELLRTAVEGADALGAHLVARLGRDFADHAGLLLAGVRRRPNDDTLTDRERQVLSLVADGLTNKQIGERLFISAKTASVHVSAIMRKLGAASRTEAAARLHGKAPVDV
jgi:DNA-binding CsgD family transcriptional regulator